MARPKKETVDFFPHYVTSGKTLFIIESKYGNDGYAFWFKLLEILGGSDGHSFRCGNSFEWEFLLAKTKVTSETATKILDTLAELGAIDKELWVEKVIWVQKLVDNLTEVYSKRKTSLPQKPSKCTPKPQLEEVSAPKTPENDIFTEVLDVKNSQSRVEESRVKESRVEEIKSPETPPPPPPQILTQEEAEFIQVLTEVKDYPLDRQADVELYNKLTERYPTLNVLTSVKEWVINKLDNPLTSKSNPRSQINNWCGKDVEWKKNIKPRDPTTVKAGKFAGLY